MKAIIIILLLAGICCTSARFRYNTNGDVVWQEDPVHEDDTIERFLRDRGISMMITTEGPEMADTRPAAVTPDPFDVDILLRPSRPRTSRPKSTTTASPSLLGEQRDEQEVETGRVMTAEFLDHHEKWIESCVLAERSRNRVYGGCKVCVKVDMIEQCHKVKSTLGGSGARRSEDSLIPRSKMTVKKTGLFGYDLTYETIGEPRRKFTVTLMEVLEVIKKVMVVKEKMVECAPKLVDYEEEHNSSISSERIARKFPPQIRLPSAMSQEFLNDTAVLVKKILSEGGNFCLEQVIGDPTNCMTIDWDPVCHNMTDGKPTLMIHRFTDDALINLFYLDQTARPVIRAYRIRKQELVDAKEGIDLLTAMMRRSRSDRFAAQPDPVLEKLDAAKSAIDFLINNLFKG